MNIIQLNISHLPQYQTLRLKGLKENPEAFGALYEEEMSQSDSFWELRLKNNIIFGTFNKNQLIGIIHFTQLSQIKTRHRGILWGMYVNPENQNKKIGSQLLAHVIEYAKNKVIQIHLTCVTTNNAAIKLYTKYDFKIYGTEPRSLFHNDIYFDEYLMVYTYNNNLNNIIF